MKNYFLPRIRHAHLCEIKKLISFRVVNDLDSGNLGNGINKVDKNKDSLTRSVNFEKRLLALSCLFLRPLGRTRLPPGGGGDIFIKFEYFLKLCRENSIFININTRITNILLEELRTFMIIYC
jgi:hypothetical protein